MKSEEIVSAFSEALKDAAKSNNGKTPWWSKSVFVIGPTAVISLLCVAALLGFFPFPLRGIIEDQEELEKGYHLETTAGQIMMIDVLTTICVNTSETNAEKNACHGGAIVADISYNDDNI